MLGGIGWWLHVGVQRAGLIAGSEHSTLPVQSILFGPDSCAANTNARVIALAASGGGTRAAVFTGALLEGLRARKLLPNVRLMSGVSGGGAALAYFASRRPQLIDAGSEPWDAYFHTMTAAYIADVMSGLGEWRVVSGTRLGVLLDESFRDHWGAADEEVAPRIYLKDVRDVGVMWNTSIAGHFFPRSGGGATTEGIELLERTHRDEWTRAATGRLVITNLAFSKPFDTLFPNVTSGDSQYSDRGRPEYQADHRCRPQRQLPTRILERRCRSSRRLSLLGD